MISVEFLSRKGKICLYFPAFSFRSFSSRIKKESCESLAFACRVAPDIFDHCATSILWKLKKFILPIVVQQKQNKNIFWDIKAKKSEVE